MNVVGRYVQIIKPEKFKNSFHGEIAKPSDLGLAIGADVFQF